MRQTSTNPEASKTGGHKPASRLTEQVAHNAALPYLPAEGLGMNLVQEIPQIRQAQLLFQTGLLQGQQQALASSIGVRQGNRHLQRLVARGSLLPRDNGDAAGETEAAPAGEPFSLQNERFASQSRLREIASGTGEALSNRDSRRPVRAVQQAPRALHLAGGGGGGAR